MNNVNDKITQALENDKELKLNVQKAVKEAVEKELVAANVIKSGEFETEGFVGCVNTLWTLACTC